MLPIFQTAIKELMLLQTSWASLLNPLLGASGGSTGASSMPSGGVVAFAGENLPGGYLWCDGQAQFKATYPELYAALKGTNGTCIYGETVTTFNTPDYRGRFLRAVNGSSGRDPDTSTRTAMVPGGPTGDAVSTLQGSQFTSHDHNTGAAANGGPLGQWTPGNPWRLVAGTESGFNLFNDAQGGAETRPINAYVYYIIKT